MAHTVVGIGNCTIDYFGVVSSVPRQDQHMQMEAFSQQCGGATAISSATLANLGVDVTFIGKVSDDHFGRLVSSSLSALGVDTKGMVRTFGQVSPFRFIAVQRRTAQRTVFWSGGDVEPLVVSEVDLTLLEGATYLLVDATHPMAQIAAAQFARGGTTKVILNVDRHKPGVDELTALANYLVVSETFITNLVPTGDLEKGLKEMKRRGAEGVVITLGEEGAIGIDSAGQIHRVGGYDVDLVDRTGAGSIFTGVLTYGLLKRWPMGKILKIANAAAAESCAGLGSCTRLPTPADIERFSV